MSARRAERRVIEAVKPMKLGASGKSRVDVGGSKEIEGDNGLRDETIP